MTTPSIRRATLQDAGVLGIVGPAAYAEAYSYLWDRPDAYGRQLETYGQRAFEDLLARPDAHVWIAEVDSSTVGFLSMIVGSRDPVERRPGGAELPRIYLLEPARRMGLGRRLLDAAIGRARDEGLSHVWLDVMASAAWARRAYAKWGFREIGPLAFDAPVRDGMRDMIVMTRDVA